MCHPITCSKRNADAAAVLQVAQPSLTVCSGSHTNVISSSLRTDLKSFQSTESVCRSVSFSQLKMNQTCRECRVTAAVPRHLAGLGSHFFKEGHLRHVCRVSIAVRYVDGLRDVPPRLTVQVVEAGLLLLLF